MFIEKIRLFWWNEIKIQNKTKENYGDLLGAYLVEKISEKPVVWVRPSRFSLRNYIAPIYVTIGSILPHVNKYCVVWGSGIISRKIKIKPAKFLAVRGPLTRTHLINQGYHVPEIYGDPALLLPNYYNPKITKRYKVGVIPHYDDFKQVSQWFANETSVTIIDLMTTDIEYTTDRILECEQIISSSLHGVILAHAYNIPAVWQKFSDKLFGDDVKFHDYFLSVKLAPYTPKIMSDELSLNDINNLLSNPNILPKPSVIEDLKGGLMACCPFKKH